MERASYPFLYFQLVILHYDFLFLLCPDLCLLLAPQSDLF